MISKPYKIEDMVKKINKAIGAAAPTKDSAKQVESKNYFMLRSVMSLLLMGLVHSVGVGGYRVAGDGCFFFSFFFSFKTLQTATAVQNKPDQGRLFRCFRTFHISHISNIDRLDRNPYMKRFAFDVSIWIAAVVDGTGLPRGKP